jgi:hypothetical protein
MMLRPTRQAILAHCSRARLSGTAGTAPATESQRIFTYFDNLEVKNGVLMGEFCVSF